MFDNVAFKKAALLGLASLAFLGVVRGDEAPAHASSTPPCGTTATVPCDEPDDASDQREPAGGRGCQVHYGDDGYPNFNPEKGALHCPNKNGDMIGLASDRKYTHECSGESEDRDFKGVCWYLINDGCSNSIKNSGTGEYMQVLPDAGRMWTAESLSSDEEELKKSPLGTLAPRLMFDIKPDTTGAHTISVRWAEGNQDSAHKTNGAGTGDSFYVRMRDPNGEIMGGPEVWKPSVVPIEGENPNFSFFFNPYKGCCYVESQNTCACTEKTVCDDPQSVAEGAVFVDMDQAKRMEVTCPAQNGAMMIIKEPSWYEFAGRPDWAGESPGHDFAVQPFDSTCEAEGTGSVDSGMNIAQYSLQKGKKYTLEFFPREDGIAIDAWYITGPGGSPPDLTLTLEKGSSTLCDEGPNVALIIVLVLLSLMLAVALVVKREQVKELASQCTNAIQRKVNGGPTAADLKEAFSSTSSDNTDGTGNYVAVGPGMNI